jgi:hypothetical protein
MIASVPLNQLAPHEGLVLPGTKNEKPEHVFMAYSDLLAIFCLPNYNLKGLVLLCQLQATRNQYYRSDFQLMLKQVILRRLFHSCYEYTDHFNCDIILLGCNEFDISHRGGGKLNICWSGHELRSHILSTTSELSDSSKYLMSDYVIYSEDNVVQNTIYVQMPLESLVKRLPIRLLCDICSKHSIHLSRGHAT